MNNIIKSHITRSTDCSHTASCGLSAARAYNQLIIIIIIIIIIILFKTGNMAHKHKQETYRQTDRQYK